MKQVHVNLNKSQFVTSDWEKVYHVLGDHLFGHLYKEYIIFLKTLDDSLVQVAGTNIFHYLSEKFGRQALYEQPPAAHVLGANPLVAGSGGPAFTPK